MIQASHLQALMLYFHLQVMKITIETIENFQTIIP